MKYSPIREFAVALPIVTIATLACGFFLTLTTDHRASFGTDPSDENGQARGDAASRLGQLGESAVSALPDLRVAACDLGNQPYVDPMLSAISKLERIGVRASAL